MKMHVVGTQKKCIREALLLSTQNIHLNGGIENSNTFGLKKKQKQKQKPTLFGAMQDYLNLHIFNILEGIFLLDTDPHPQMFI